MHYFGSPHLTFSKIYLRSFLAISDDFSRETILGSKSYGLPKRTHPPPKFCTAAERSDAAIAGSGSHLYVFFSSKHVYSPNRSGGCTLDSKKVIISCMIVNSFLPVPLQRFTNDEKLFFPS
jgi:hypothetical protein